MALAHPSRYEQNFEREIEGYRRKKLGTIKRYVTIADRAAMDKIPSLPSEGEPSLRSMRSLGPRMAHFADDIAEDGDDQSASCATSRSSCTCVLRADARRSLGLTLARATQHRSANPTPAAP